MSAPQPPDLLRDLRTGDWLDAQDFPPLRWAVPGLVPEGMSLLVGGPKIGKSWLSLAVALGVASGGRVLGKVAAGPPRPVLLLALEDGDRRLRDRARELLAGDPIPARFAYLTRVEPGTVLPTIEAWLDTLDPSAEPLVVLDTLGKVMPPALLGESAYQRDYRAAGRLKSLCDRRPGMALLVLHHDRKAQADDFVDGVSGTNGIAGAADTILVLHRPRTESRGLLKVTGRDVIEREYALAVAGGAWTLVGDDLDDAAAAAGTVKATVNLGDRSAEIVRYAAEHPTGVRAADTAAHLGISPNDAARYLARLHDAGRLDRPKRGLYTPVCLVFSVLSRSDTKDKTDRGSREGAQCCAECGDPLHPALVGNGETTHPSCYGG